MTRQPNPTDDMTFEEVGFHFGYPPCCIATRTVFVIRIRLGDPSAITEAQQAIETKANLPWFGTGFVPCPACESRIGDTRAGFDKFVAEVIAPNRACPHPFPQDYWGKPETPPQTGSLDQGAPNHFDHTKRGFTP